MVGQSEIHGFHMLFGFTTCQPLQSYFIQKLDLTIMVSDYTGQYVFVPRNKTRFLANGVNSKNDLSFSWLATIFAAPQLLIFGKKINL